MTNETTQRLNCGHCNIEVDMQMISTAKREIASDQNLKYAEWESFYWYLYLCPSCKRPTLVQYHTNTLYAEHDHLPVDTQILYPHLSTIGHYLPEKILKEFVSALKVKKADANAFAVMIGRILERICADKNAVGGTLNEQLLDLSEKKLLPETIATAANKIRHLRNVGAHASIGEVNRDDVEALHALLNSIIEYLYRAPALIAELEKSLSKASD